MNSYMILPRVISLIKTTVPPGVDVYDGIVPESVVGTGVSVSNTGFSDEDRTLEGQRASGSSLWRVTVSGPSKPDINDVVNAILAVDNTINDDFQRIYVSMENIEAKEPGDTIFRVFLSVEVYN